MSNDDTSKGADSPVKPAVLKRLPDAVSELLKRPAAPMGYVRGTGTPTMRSEQYFEQLYQDAERRRDESNREKRASLSPQRGGEEELAKVIDATVEKGGGLMHTSQMTNHPEIPKAYLKLSYVNRVGQQIYGKNGKPVECLADLIVGDSDDPSELTLMIVCPRCMSQGQKHEQDCQLRINQCNKYFEFIAGKGEPEFIWEEELSDGRIVKQVYKSAGMITESEKCKCPDCHWTFRIDKNRVWVD